MEQIKYQKLIEQVNSIVMEAKLDMKIAIREEHLDPVAEQHVASAAGNKMDIAHSRIVEAIQVATGKAPIQERPKELTYKPE